VILVLFNVMVVFLLNPIVTQLVPKTESNYQLVTVHTDISKLENQLVQLVTVLVTLVKVKPITVVIT
jgi:hypothetical protein